MKVFRPAILALAVLFIVSTSALALPASGTTNKGIDVSRYQGAINFAEVKGAGIETVYIRAGEGDSYTDPNFEQNYQDAKAQGLRIGFYYYVTATTEAEGTIQGKRFAALVSGKEYDCRLAMDFEALSGLKRSEINAISLAFLSALSSDSENIAVIYSDWSNAHTFGNALSNYPLWIAEYGVTEPRDLNAWSSWVGWQYSDDGSVSGISGNVDLDYFTDDILISTSSPTATPEPTATPAPTATPEPTAAPAPTATPEPTAAPEPTATPTPTPTPISGTYTIIIQSGDCLNSISRRYGVSVDDLVSLNGISNPDLIYAGYELLIPQTSNSSATYTVQSGDTLSKIALHNSTSVEALAALNGIDNVNLIYIGQVIKLVLCVT